MAEKTTLTFWVKTYTKEYADKKIDSVLKKIAKEVEKGFKGMTTAPIFITRVSLFQEKPYLIMTQGHWAFGFLVTPYTKKDEETLEEALDKGLIIKEIIKSGRIVAEIEGSPTPSINWVIQGLPENGIIFETTFNPKYKTADISRINAQLVTLKQGKVGFNFDYLSLIAVAFAGLKVYITYFENPRTPIMVTTQEEIIVNKPPRRFALLMPFELDLPTTTQINLKRFFSPKEEE